MIGSLFTAITGLQSFQQQMNVVANNIANVNTLGFKSSETLFESMLSQTFSGASAPTATGGGTNPRQIGLGVQLTGVVPIFTQGSAQTTGKPTDMMIQGNGFFVMNGNGAAYYTRDGGFDRDGTGSIVNPATGMNVMGFQAQGSPPAINTSAPLTPLNVPSNFASFSISSTGILTGINSTGSTTVLGQVALATFPNPSGLLSQGNNLYTPTLNSGLPSTTSAVPQFNANTTVTASNFQQVTVPSLAPPNGTTFTTIPSGITVGTSTTWTAAAPTSPMSLTFTVAGGAVTTANLNVNGVATALTVAAGPPTTLTAPAANGTLVITIPTTALTNIPNATGYTINLGGSGGINGLPGTNGLGTVTPGALEMSNVDLSREFSNMIIAERGFQANSKTITTSDSILTTLVNMKGQ